MLGRFVHANLEHVLRCPCKHEAALDEWWLPALTRQGVPTAKPLDRDALGLHMTVPLRAIGLEGYTYHSGRSGCVNDRAIRHLMRIPLVYA